MLFRAVLIATLFLLGALFGLALARRLRRRSFARARARGAAGEERARRELLHRGFTIVSEQAELETTLLIDGVEHPYTVRVDFLVEAHGRRALVEVKTGKAASLPPTPEVRRQLREYAALYDVEECYLMDGDRLTMSRIVFGPAAGSRSTWWIWLARLGAGGLAIWALLRLARWVRF